MPDNLDLLLVNVGNTRKKVYQDLSKNYSAVEPPFWAALTAGFVRNKGYNVSILDANALNLTHEETAEKIEKMNPKLTDIVVYGQQPSGATQIMGGVNILAKEIKKRAETKLILTGLHPSALPERTLREESCDYVAEGEGFYTLLGLLENKKMKNEKLEEIPGLWYKQDGKIFNNQRAENIKDLDIELSDVAWDLLPMDKYLAHNWHCLHDLNSRKSYVALYTTLGCPFTCNFCCINAPFGKSSYRTWSPEWVLKQIDKLVRKYDVKNIKFIDELFVLNPKHFLPIAEGLVERGLGENGEKINIWAYARVDTTKEQYLEKLKKAGVNWLALGIESGSEGIRKDVSKGNFTQENIIDVVKKIKNADINVLGNYMFGFQDDDLQSMQETLDLALELNCEWANFYSAMAYPGSELYEEAVKNGTKLPDSWIGYSQHSYECMPLPTKKVSAEEVLRFRDYAFNTYYKNPIYLAMIEKRFGIDARKHIEEMAKYKLKRKILGD